MLETLAVTPYLARTYQPTCQALLVLPVIQALQLLLQYRYQAGEISHRQGSIIHQLLECIPQELSSAAIKRHSLAAQGLKSIRPLQLLVESLSQYSTFPKIV